MCQNGLDINVRIRALSPEFDQNVTTSTAKISLVQSSSRNLQCRQTHTGGSNFIAALDLLLLMKNLACGVTASDLAEELALVSPLTLLVAG